ncbi:Aminoglycoside phosphotransferase [Penicillium diatomitis]|uniref:Aminoglycoside phosphotransferase n=1 Tax=Penicillium diatomitis TaxID=2819901 RepID=A0A9W9XLT4_9EURO|nr:Aminoglycoside phosphotransferase [Penicillium diatomitis]KAJ5495253.1 Aminoglycoside phosphotransferase [Penicillium diatomitis]
MDPFHWMEKILILVANEALTILLVTAPVLHQLGETPVVRLLENLIMKGGSSVMISEAEALRLVAARTTIRGPRVHRSFEQPTTGNMRLVVSKMVDKENTLSELREEATRESQSATVRMVKRERILANDEGARYHQGWEAVLPALEQSIAVSSSFVEQLAALSSRIAEPNSRIC